MNMTKQEAIEILTEMRDLNDYITQSDALQMAIDALEKEPAANSEDAISRQAVLDGLEKYHDGADLHIDGLTYAYDLVCKLPSVSTGKPCEDAISRQAAIVRCKDCRKHNVSVGYTKDCCPLYEFRGISYGHEHDYQFCCFAERRTDERSD
jgi:hypothetical protein